MRTATALLITKLVITGLKEITIPVQYYIQCSNTLDMAALIDMPRKSSTVIVSISHLDHALVNHMRRHYVSISHRVCAGRPFHDVIATRH